MPKYTRDQLLGLRAHAHICTLDSDVTDLIRSLGRPRGCRAGRQAKNKQSRRRPSPGLHPVGNGASVVTGNRPLVVKSRRQRSRVLRAVPVSVNPLLLKVGTFNARSVANKVASVCDWICDNNLHFAAIVETWHDGIDSPSIIACTPPGYRSVERARPRTETASSRRPTTAACVCSMSTVSTCDLCRYRTTTRSSTCVCTPKAQV